MRIDSGGKRRGEFEIKGEISFNLIGVKEKLALGNEKGELWDGVNIFG